MMKRIVGATGIGLLSASLASCGHVVRLRNLDLGDHYAALSSCSVSDWPEGRRIRCEYGDGSETVTINEELTYFTIVKDGLNSFFYSGSRSIIVDGFTINPENGRLAKEAEKKHWAMVEFLYKNEKGEK